MAEGRPEASCRASIASAPTISVSQAEGVSALLAMLITAQGTIPKYSSIDVQHWTAVASSRLAAIQSSSTAPNLAILSRAAAGTSWARA